MSRLQTLLFQAITSSFPGPLSDFDPLLQFLLVEMVYRLHNFVAFRAPIRTLEAALRPPSRHGAGRFDLYPAAGLLPESKQKN